MHGRSTVTAPSKMRAKNVICSHIGIPSHLVLSDWFYGFKMVLLTLSCPRMSCTCVINLSSDREERSELHKLTPDLIVLGRFTSKAGQENLVEFLIMQHISA